MMTEEKVLMTRVFDMDLTVRTSNIMIQNGINTIDDILKTGKVRLATLPHFGRRQMEELEEVLEAYKLKLPTGLQQTMHYEEVDYVVTVIDEGFRYEVSAFGKTPRVVRASSPQLAIVEFNKPPSESGLRTSEESGYIVGYSGKLDNKNPFRIGSEHNRRWQVGYDRGVAEKKAELATVEAPPRKELPERVAVEIGRDELKVLHDYWLDKARTFERHNNKEDAGRAFERSCRFADLRHEVK